MHVDRELYEDVWNEFNKPRFNWEAIDRLSELEQFKQECNVLFQGPLSEMKDP